MHNTPAPRPAAQRTREVLDRLATEREVWVATAHPDHGPHQVPLWFAWDGHALWMCTGAHSATVRNLRRDARVHLSLPDSLDVVLVQGEAECFTDSAVPAAAADAFGAKFGWDPRTEDRPHVYVRVTPRTVRAWRGVPELEGRVIMREGAWLNRATA
ncbi:pyridoxamine 5'-phosphate oxidase family protein [Streptomyces sp. NPDC050418]|uniref:pyridoxamine 5'-phosphate oxidase family protein n=1 Tax=Streptomyces sp. NPDC050418 TaxID=3365612 RepID=UPI0037B030FD